MATATLCAPRIIGVEHGRVQTLHTCLSRCLAPASKSDPPPLAIWIGVEDDREFDADRIYGAITPEGWRHEWVGFDEWPSWTPPADEKRLLLVAPFVRTDSLR